MKKEILIMLVIIGAFAFFQSISFVRMPDTKGSPLLLQTDESNFYAHVQRSEWALLEFWSPTCILCKKMKPSVNALAENYEEKVNILSINIDESISLANEFQISGTPTMVLLYKGREVSRVMGFRPKEVLTNWLEGFIVDDETVSL